MTLSFILVMIFSFLLEEVKALDLVVLEVMTVVSSAPSEVGAFEVALSTPSEVGVVEVEIRDGETTPSEIAVCGGVLIVIFGELSRWRSLEMVIK